MENKKNIYISFLRKNSIQGGGHIETKAELKSFSKLFGEIDFLCSDFKIKSKSISIKFEDSQKYLYTKSCNKFIPIFGKRPNLDSIKLSKYAEIIVADSRCFIAFFQALLNKRRVNFKSHGSLAYYFYDFLKANFYLFKFRPIKSCINFFYYLSLVIIFFFVELLIYIFAKKIFIMRSKESLKYSIWGNLYLRFFSYKTQYSFCPSVESFQKLKDIPFSTVKSFNKNKTNLLIIGNWTLIHNFASLLDFIERLELKTALEVFITGNILNNDAELILRKYKSRKNISIEILGFVKNIAQLKEKCNFVIACANYGSGIPIKTLEIINDSNEFKYKPIISNYCKNSLIGLLKLDKIEVYPEKGPIDIFK